MKNEHQKSMIATQKMSAIIHKQKQNVNKIFQIIFSYRKIYF